MPHKKRKKMLGAAIACLAVALPAGAGRDPETATVPKHLDHNRLTVEATLRGLPGDIRVLRLDRGGSPSKSGSR
jgi:hypothetical protein